MLMTVHRTNFLTASSITLILIGLLQPALAPVAWAGDASAEPKSIRKTCGKCPDGYATTGVTEAPELCKDGDPTLDAVCSPGCEHAAGLRILSRRVSRSRAVHPCRLVVEAKTEDGFRNANWRKWNEHLPDPAKGGKICPPDCGSTPPPGRGALPPPPKYVPAPETPQ